MGKNMVAGPGKYHRQRIANSLHALARCPADFY
jgi:hypothetical protein